MNSRPLPAPDEVLARFKEEARNEKRGKLKIFLGYAAGVGKTYAMLEAAQQRRGNTDVVAALVETHGRRETEALLNGLDVIPCRQSDYRGIKVREMDLDAILGRHPGLALVDELAHTNAPDARHPKRYQDVEELLEAGIDVYTTLNVQHVESLRNDIAQITGVWMRETIPDAMIDQANEIELVDLPPDELLQRLQEGKVYLPEQAALATERFFRKGNLLALRELALRVVADRVDKQAQAFKTDRGGQKAAGELVMVCLSPGFASDRLVRGARRLAVQLDADLIAVNVETSDNQRLSPAQKEQLDRALRLAERLGARIETIQGGSVAETVVVYAQKHNVTKIVIGGPQARKGARLFSQSTVNQIVRQAGDIGVYVIGGAAEQISQKGAALGYTVGELRGYGYGALLIAAATLLGFLLHPIFDPTNIVMFYLLGVVITAARWGLGPSIMVSFVGVLAFDFFFVPPYLTFRIQDTQYFFTFIAILGVGILLSYITARVRWQTEAAKRREHEVSTLYNLAKRLATVAGRTNIVNTVLESASQTFSVNAVLFLPDAEKNNTLKPYLGEFPVIIGDNEVAAVTWCFEHGKIAGQGTDTLPNARARFQPLITSRATVGVFALLSDQQAPPLNLERSRLLEAFADLAAVAIERAKLAEEASHAEVLRNSEKLQTALLNSISHDVRTPLVSIIGALGSLEEKGVAMDEASRASLLQLAREEADRLNHLITNLLDVSRLEAGAIKLSREPSDLQEIIGVALERLGNRGSKNQIIVRLPKDLPFVSADSSLMAQVFVNVLDNAIKYSPEGSPIDISARVEKRGEVEVQVADVGIGIPPNDLEMVFDKFYRVQRPENVAGSGLGLAIAKGLVEAHGGRISARNRSPQGTIIQFTLPVGVDQK
jgi:two-component system sensor histidine kinase KdpD